MRPSREKEDKQRKGGMIKSWNSPHIQSLRQESGVSRLDRELMKMEVKENQERDFMKPRVEMVSRRKLWAAL